MQTKKLSEKKNYRRAWRSLRSVLSVLRVSGERTARFEANESAQMIYNYFSNHYRYRYVDFGEQIECEIPPTQRSSKNLSARIQLHQRGTWDFCWSRISIWYSPWYSLRNLRVCDFQSTASTGEWWRETPGLEIWNRLCCMVKIAIRIPSEMIRTFGAAVVADENADATNHPLAHWVSGLDRCFWEGFIRRYNTGIREYWLGPYITFWTN